MEVVIILFILAYPSYLVAKWALIFWEYGKEEKLPEVNLSGKLHEPPSGLKPYFVDALSNRTITPTGKSISSTILYLMKQKFINISYKDKFTDGGIRKRVYFLELDESKAKEIKNLPKLEQRFLAFIFQGVGNKASFSKIKSYHINEASATRQFWKYWSDEISFSLMELNFLDRKSFYLRSSMARDIALAGSVMTGMFYVFMNFIYDDRDLRKVFLIQKNHQIIFLGMVLSFVVLLLFLMLIFIKKHFYKRTPEGNMEYSKWLTFKKWMEDYSVTKRYPIDSLVLWEEYLIYGIALGVSKKALSDLPIKYEVLYEFVEGFGGGDSYEGDVSPTLLGGFSQSDFIYSLIESIAFLPKLFGKDSEMIE